VNGGNDTDLGDTAVGERPTPGAGGSPNEEHLYFKTSRIWRLVDQVGRGVTDAKVPEPVRGGGEGHGLCANVEREDFTGDDPSDGTPGGGEEGNVDADESNQNLLPSGVRHGDRDTDNGDQELANAHSGGSNQQQPSATKFLDTPHARKGHENTDDADDDGDQERVLNAGVLEENGTVVGDEVDTSELLPRLDKDTGEGS